MKSHQHRMIAKWHIEQANMHDHDEAHSCGCPVEHATMTNGEILKVMKARPVQEPYVRGPLAVSNPDAKNPRNTLEGFTPYPHSTDYKNRIKSEEFLNGLR